MRALPLLLISLILSSFALAANVHDYDVVVYGGTSAGVIAAVQAKKMGKSVVVVGPDKHLGGLSSSGLGWTDTGDKSVIGGLAREFYHRVWQHYQRPEAWTFQRREDYKLYRPAEDAMWTFEPRVAEQLLRDLKETGSASSDRPDVGRPNPGGPEPEAE